VTMAVAMESGNLNVVIDTPKRISEQ
jgi:hypothetical protein